MSASPQVEDGHIKIANELFEAMLAFPFSPRQLKVVLAIMRKTYGFNKKRDDVSASQLAQVCAMQRPHVSEVLGQLAAMRVIFKEPGRFGTFLEINKDYSQWVEVGASTKKAGSRARVPLARSFHYTYRVTRTETNEYYLGVRSCSCHPNQDRYVGSGNWTVKAADLHKEVIGVFETRQLAEQAEKQLIRAAAKDPFLKNVSQYASTESVHPVQTLYTCTESVQGSAEAFAVNGLRDACTDSVHHGGCTESVQVASTESVHTKDNLPKDISLSRPKRNSTDTDTDTDFEEAWRLYPKRDGDNPKAKARKAWNARRREGISAAAMIDGVRRYAKQVNEAGNAGTRFVKMAATFFGPDHHFVGESDAATAASTDSVGVSWWRRAGFEKEWQATNEGCVERYAHLWRNGKRVPNEILAAEVQP